MSVFVYWWFFLKAKTINQLIVLNTDRLQALFYTYSCKITSKSNFSSRHMSTQALVFMDKDARVTSSYILSSIFQSRSKYFLCIITSLSKYVGLNWSVSICKHLWYTKCLSMKNQKWHTKYGLTKIYLNSLLKKYFPWDQGFGSALRCVE